MGTSLKIIVASLALALLSSVNAYASTEEVSDDVRSACEEEAQGQNDPEAYTKQCIEEMLNMLKEEGSQEDREKSE